MKEITVKVYTLDELSEEAQDKAIQWYHSTTLADSSEREQDEMLLAELFDGMTEEEIEAWKEGKL